MTLAGANNFSENSNSTIYTINSQQTGQYSIVMPKNPSLTLLQKNIHLDLIKSSFFYILILRTMVVLCYNVFG